MDDLQKRYYWSMVEHNRGLFILREGRLVAIITYFIAFEDDDRYLYERVPWTIIKDDGQGDTLYIDQFLTKENTSRYIHCEFSKVLKKLKQEFPNLKRAKWLRASSDIRKKGVEYARTQTKFIVHCKDFKQCRVR